MSTDMRPSPQRSLHWKNEMVKVYQTSPILPATPSRVVRGYATPNNNNLFHRWWPRSPKGERGFFCFYSRRFPCLRKSAFSVSTRQISLYKEISRIAGIPQWPRKLGLSSRRLRSDPLSWISIRLSCFRECRGIRGGSKPLPATDNPPWRDC